MFQVRCWQCGKMVDIDQAVRRNVVASEATSQQGFALPTVGTHTSRVDLCPDCSVKRDAVRKQRLQRTTMIILAMVAVLAVFVAALLIKGIR